MIMTIVKAMGAGTMTYKFVNFDKYNEILKSYKLFIHIGDDVNMS